MVRLSDCVVCGVEFELEPWCDNESCPDCLAGTCPRPPVPTMQEALDAEWLSEFRAEARAYIALTDDGEMPF